MFHGDGRFFFCPVEPRSRSFSNMKCPQTSGYILPQLCVPTGARPWKHCPGEERTWLIPPNPPSCLSTRCVPHSLIAPTPSLNPLIPSSPLTSLPTSSLYPPVHPSLQRLIECLTMRSFGCDAKPATGSSSPPTCEPEPPRVLTLPPPNRPRLEQF